MLCIKVCLNSYSVSEFVKAIGYFHNDTALLKAMKLIDQWWMIWYRCKGHCYFAQLDKWLVWWSSSSIIHHFIIPLSSQGLVEFLPLYCRSQVWKVTLWMVNTVSKFYNIFPSTLAYWCKLHILFPFICIVLSHIDHEKPKRVPLLGNDCSQTNCISCLLCGPQ